MVKKPPYAGRIVKVLGSSLFFKAVVAALVLQAAWIALSGRYPMAFDESYHLGIIRLYAHHLSPFWDGQPAGADQFGAVFRDPSYLYHYLMSFPYRLISLVTPNQAAQVLFLRGLNIALAAYGLVLYRRLLLKTGASKALAHVCLALFILLPIMPLLAAQINYDNLLLPFTAATLLLAVRFGQSPNIRRFAGLLTVCMAGCLIKFAFLPIAVAAFGYGLWFAKHRGLGRFDIKSKLSWLLVAVLLLSGFMFFERYGDNLARYDAPVPDCEKVLSEGRCEAYGPWLRDKELTQIKPGNAATTPLDFVGHWFSGMWLRTFFAVDGSGTLHQTRGPLLVPGIGAAILAAIGLAAAVIKLRQILSHYDRAVLWLFLSVSGLYITTLVIQEYQAFVSTGQAVAVNGRYLLIIYPLLFLIAGLGLSELLRRRPNLKAAAAVTALICLLWGGGALTFILRSNDAWYWNNGAARAANHAVQRVLGPVTPGYYTPLRFLRFNS
jgi:hypothetical protein